MHAIAVDDKAMPLRTLTKAICAAEPDVDLAEFRTAEAALEYDRLGEVDVAFLDIDMPGMGGVQLAQELKLKNPHINIIFATGFSEYVSDAMSMHASGYLLKPITPKKVKAELDDLRYPIKQDKPRGIYCHCFGNFDVYCDGRRVSFKRRQTLELMAYLVDRRGSMCSIHEIVGILWEDSPESASMRSQVRNLISDLSRTFAGLGYTDVLERQYGSVALNPAKISCDYYDFLEGTPQALRAYTGEYMSQFTWAELSHAAIEQRLARM